MKTFTAFVLSCLVFLPCHSEDLKFDAFLPKFRILYANYHFGPKWPQQKIDKEAARIWQGCHNYEIASVCASQGVFETHFNSDPFIYGHRGNMGMRVNTIIMEALRLGLIQKKPEDIKWMLKMCRHDPQYADFLAASRLCYLIQVCGDEKKALRVWVRGSLRGQNEDDRKASLSYSKGVLTLKKIMFGDKNDSSSD